MKKTLTLLVLSLAFFACKSQRIETREIFNLYAYHEDCKVVVPEYFAFNRYFYYEEKVLYSLNQTNWCAFRENVSDFNIPPGVEVKDYRIVNDSTCVFFSVNDYKVLYYFNFKNSTLIKTESLLNYYGPDQIGNKIMITGGAFGNGNYYYISSRRNGSQNVEMYKFDLVARKLDTLDWSYPLENELVNIKSSNNYIVVNSGVYKATKNLAIDVIDLIEKSTYSLSERSPESNRILAGFKILDFIDDNILLLHNKYIPYKFALLNIKNCRVKPFELDKNIFSLHNIRKEEVLEDYVEGPNEGINQLYFRYYVCRIPDSSVIISFTDKRDNRVGYLIDFGNVITQLD